ncbi:hypothetical protein U9816_11960, partial [Escherichia coli]
FDTCSCQTARCFNKSKGVLITGLKLKAFRNPQPSWGFSVHKKWPISLLARQRGISYFYYYAVTLSDGVTRLSLNLTILPILLGKMTLFFGPPSGVCLLRFFV